MKLNKKQVARQIDKLASIRAKQALLNVRADQLVLQIKKAGGGESKRWLAQIVQMPRKVVVVKAHKQLRLFPRKP